ncbi:MAG: hypothetical protein KDN19_20815 [Verrucomicrobiae bacterium]|nr:hypothetical protein [Verrucomicrobiae bacterium]
MTSPPSWNRRRFLQSGLATAALPIFSSHGKEDAAIAVGSERQLFLDDFLIDTAKTKGVARSLNRPSRIERVLKPDQPAERFGFIFYCSVVDDGSGTAKLYHGSYDLEKKRHFAVSTSEDGLHWTNPDLGQVEFQGSRHNNLLPLDAVETSVFLDPNAPPEKRYRMLYSRYWPDPEKAGIYLASSADGIHWTASDTRLLPFVPDSQHCAVWDAEIRKYVIYTRTWNPVRAITRVAVEDLEKPWPYDTTTPTRFHWGKDKVPTLSHEFPTVMAVDERDPEGVQLYTNAISKYPWAANAYVGFPATYQTYNGPDWKDRALNGNDGTFDVQFASSRDGIAWDRRRSPYVAAGYHDGLDLRLVSMGPGFVRRGRELYQYFVGWPHRHGHPSMWEKDMALREEWLQKDLGGIYCATQRVDGFVSMEAGYPGGSFTTKPLTFDGDRLLLNLHANGSGGVKVALLGESGEPLPGFGEDDCKWINLDEIDHEVKWKADPELAQHTGNSVRLRFTLRNAKVFAFQFMKRDTQKS